jgi:SAM-dependent methyltransferase
LESLAVVPDLEFTGERIVPGKTQEALFREHEERYVFAGQYVAGKDVLDIACGTGVGTFFLKQAGARSVVGIDIDAQAVAFAQANYQGCRFEVGDATEISLRDACVDVVVSFETLEHISDQSKFLAECKRVLRPGGLLICSTPNTKVYRWLGRNNYHVHELTFGDFHSCLQNDFASVELYAQQEVMYPLYVLRRLLVRLLVSLRLKQSLVTLLARNEDVNRRCFFSAGTDVKSIRVFRQLFFKKPMYLVAVAHKRSSACEF